MKFRILHCVETIGAGGVEQRRLSIARLLNQERYEQQLTCTKVIGNFRTKLESAGTKVWELGEMGSPFNLKYYSRLLRVIREFQPHIIHGAVFEGVISAVVGGMICRTPIIVIEETSQPINRSWRGHGLFKMLANCADLVIATSPTVHEYITQDIGVPKTKSTLVLNGVEPTSPATQNEIAALRTNLGLDVNNYVIGSVGRLKDDPKLFSILIKSFAAFSKKHSEARLLLVGDGADRLRLEKLAEDLGVSKLTIFAGHQTDLHVFYAIMDMFALVSASEGFGLAVVEAMFAGIPVVVSRAGGLQNIVSDAETGLLVDIRDIEGLTKAIDTLYSDRSLAQSYGERAKKKAFELFTARRYVADLEQVYDKLCARIP